ncbi:MAG TPA: hypothetical protein EYP35_00570 [Desulfobacterales bacterium]|nr:hypothetical protein [Desulfobacterales bacterium]HIP38329.1 hypothetical protein [Desulfocapsa sulfexigens]
MNAAQLIPTPDVLQVPWGWFQVLLTVTFFMHLVVMNILLGCSIITFLRHASGKSTDVNKAIAGKLPLTVAFTVNFGVAPLLFLQVLYGNFMYTSSVLMAIYWLSIFAIVIFAYYGAYIYTMNYDRIVDYHTVLTGFIAGSLLAVAFILTNNLSFMTNVEAWPAYFNNAEGTLLNFTDRSLFPRYLHSVLGAIAVGGLSIAFYYDLKKRKGDTEAEANIKIGMNWFAGATMLNFGVGTWYWGLLPDSVRSLTGNGSAFFLFFLVLGTVTAILSLIYGLRHKVRPAVYYLLGSLFSMVLVREFARRLTLAPWFKTSDLEVVPQYSPMIAFLVSFAGGLWLIWYMIRLVLTDKEVNS